MTKENKPLKSILFVSRNKDNKHIPNFKERRYVRLTTKTAEELKKDEMLCVDWTGKEN